MANNFVQKPSSNGVRRMFDLMKPVCDPSSLNANFASLNILPNRGGGSVVARLMGREGLQEGVPRVVGGAQTRCQWICPLTADEWAVNRRRKRIPFCLRCRLRHDYVSTGATPTL